MARCSSSPPQAVKIAAKPKTDATIGTSGARQRELADHRPTTTPTANNTTLRDEALRCGSWLYKVKRRRHSPADVGSDGPIDVR